MNVVCRGVASGTVPRHDYYHLNPSLPGSLGRAYVPSCAWGSGFLLKEPMTQLTLPRRVVAQIEVQLLLLLAFFQVPFMEAVLVKKHFFLNYKILYFYTLFYYYYNFFQL